MGDAGAEFPTTLGADANFKGQLQFEKGARLLGKFEGEVSTKGQMIIAEGAKFSGEAHAGDICVEGQVNGNLHAGGKVQLAASGRLEGDIHAARLEVAEGAVLIGRCAVGAKSDTRPPVEGKPVSAVVETMPGTRPEERVKPKGSQPPAAVPAKK
ncbi:MAG: polymer-forming cytoskeletal protein [Phycisphaerae bacterium]